MAAARPGKVRIDLLVFDVDGVLTDGGVVIHSDGWPGYEELVDVGHAKHLRIHHGNHQFADARRHINGIESFWSFAKRRMLKFNGLRQEKFLLHLKECEYRFNHRRDNLYQTLLSLLRSHPL